MTPMTTRKRNEATRMLPVEALATTTTTRTDPVGFLPWPFDVWDRDSPTATICATVFRHPRHRSRITGSHCRNRSHNNNNNNNYCRSQAPRGPRHSARMTRWQQPPPETAVHCSSRGGNRHSRKATCPRRFCCDLLDLRFSNKRKRQRRPPPPPLAITNRGWPPKPHRITGTGATTAPARTVYLTRFLNTMKSYLVGCDHRHIRDGTSHRRRRGG